MHDNMEVSIDSRGDFQQKHYPNHRKLRINTISANDQTIDEKDEFQVVDDDDETPNKDKSSLKRPSNTF